jgi:hypothetical protein
MAGKPFKIAQPPARNTNATTSPAAPYQGQTIVRSERTGDPLPDDLAPAHSPELKFPQPAPGVGHKPFKLSK